MATQTSKTTRPGYVQDFTSNLINSINNAPEGNYVNLNYAGMNQDQTSALNTMMNNPQFNSSVDKLMGAGQEGLSTLDNIYSRISDAYKSGNISAADVQKLASQLYSPTDVEGAINAQNAQSERRYSTDTQTNIAQQTMQESGFGSSQRLAKSRGEEQIATEEQANANNIADTAYNNAVNQATSILTGNRANQLNALGALASNASNQAGMYNTAATMSQGALAQGVQASQQLLQNQQNQYNNDYANQQNAQNYKLQAIQRKLDSAGALNAALGQTTKQTVSGGGSGMLGGMASGAMAGSAFGPWGMLAGAAIGGVAAASQG